MVRPACTTQACSKCRFTPERKIILEIRKHRSKNCGLVINTGRLNKDRDHRMASSN